MGAMGKYENLGGEKDWSKAPFGDFAKALKGSDNINTAPFSGEYPERAAFLKALVGKAGITDKGLVSAPDRVQPFTAVTKDGNIYIENLGPTKTNDFGVTTGTYKTWTIKPDFSAIAGTKPYVVDQSAMMGCPEANPSPVKNKMSLADASPAQSTENILGHGDGVVGLQVVGEFNGAAVYGPVYGPGHGEKIGSQAGPGAVHSGGKYRDDRTRNSRSPFKRPSGPL